MQKKFFIFTIFLLLAFPYNVGAVSYRDIILQERGSFSLERSTLSEAKLLQTYVWRYKNNINTIFTEYGQNDVKILNDTNTILDTMSKALTAVQEEQIPESQSGEILQDIVQDLKTMNARIKQYLNSEKERQEQELATKKQQYVLIGKKISRILDGLIEQSSQILAKKIRLTEGEKQIVASLVKIRDENNKIKAFESRSFGNEEEMKEYFQKIIESIRGEIIKIKGISN